MKKIYTLLLITISTFCTAQQTFQLTIGGSANDYGNSIQQTSDNGYIVSGTTFSYGSNGDAYLVKLDAYGTIQWTKTYGGSALEEGNDVIQTTDGGFLMVGQTSSFSNSQDIYLVKTNSSGDTTWTRTFGGSSDDYGNRVVEFSPGKYILTGSVSLSGSVKMAVLTIDSNGTLLSQKYLSDPNFASPRYKGTVFPDHTIGMFGHGDLLSTTDTIGTYIQTFNYSYNGPTTDAIYTLDSNYALLLRTDIGSGQGSNVVLAKLNPQTGVLAWAKKFGTSADDDAVSVVQNTDNSFAIAATTHDIGSGNGRIMLLKVSSTGVLQWTKIFSTGSAEDHTAGMMIKTNDGGYAIAGSVTIGGSFNNINLIIIKTDSTGESGCNQTAGAVTSGIASDFPPLPVSQFAGTMSNNGSNTSSSLSTGGSANVLCLSMAMNDVMRENDVAIFPNPSTGIFRIAFQNSLAKNISVYDSFGRLVTQQNVNGDESRIDLSVYAKGIYFLKVEGEGKRWTNKLVVL